jgi:hypothetical protein
MTHPDLMMALAKVRIDDLRRSAAPGASAHNSRQRLRKFFPLFAHRWQLRLVGNAFWRDRSAPPRLDGIERVNRELLRSR